jgi:hypothetical protein
MWGRLVQAIARLFGLGATRTAGPRAISRPEPEEAWPFVPGPFERIFHSPRSRSRKSVVEIPDGFQDDRSVLITDGTTVRRIGRCVIGGPLSLYRAHRLTEVDPNIVVQGLTLREASELVALPAGLHIDGHLTLINCTQLRSLPEGLRVSGSLVVRGCPRLEGIGHGVHIGGDVHLVGKTRLTALPSDLSVGGHVVIEKAVAGFELLAGTAPGFALPGNLALIGCTGLRELPASLRVGGDLIIRRCPNLTRLPANLQVAGGLEVRFAQIETIPDDLRVGTFLDLEGCTRLVSLPEDLEVPGALRLRRCTHLERLPGGLRVGLDAAPLRSPWHIGALGRPQTRSPLFRGLDLQGCSRLTALPADLRVQGRIEVAGSGITGLPFELRADQVLSWRGVAVPPKVAFQPESFGKAEFLGYPNTEVRRVLMERLGAERLITLLHPKVRDEDRDAGGQRRLLEISLEGAGDTFVYLECRCPSTQRTYLLRAPPTTRTCRQAAAWIAGFENPDDYQPQLET